MKNTLKRFACLFLGLIMILSLSQPVSALTSEVSSVRAGTWYTAAGHTYSLSTGTTYYFYRFKVGSGCYVRVDLAQSGTSSETGLYITKNPTRSEKSVQYVCLRNGETRAARYIYLPKGTYYASSYNPIRFKLTIGKASNLRNYTASRAAALSAGTSTVVVQTPAAQYLRWYKIKVTKKHRLTMYSNNQYNVSLYDASFKKVSLKNQSGSTKFRTASKVRKGTYYVVIGRNDTPGRSSVTTFIWK